ncbi:MAG: hypothetical protein A2161_06675 [Candidatus Schekmanbacteria bacterium RBG_13_48_7]|uniref:DUF86 domain-containing protein n=1 Tax=Candidatus Schekmanbacteria bacterium RBG_13_48_7 TaxID=1817878 RepID=A0A1F7RLA2_9BACT|nr:MAG: hypothetical protein A2161_06675 [Candidatus Schekmanbacteria bacterium RBG_13_48_7]
MINKKMIADRIARIRENLKLLKFLGTLSEEEFTADWKNISATERMFQVSIEACLDIGNHLIAEFGLSRPQDYKNIFKILCDNSIITRNLSDN